jgi:hypothetical protein
MKLIALEMPDDAADLAGWLEGQLVGLDLSTLVAELETIGGLGEGPATPPLSLETILGKERDAVLAHGLASLAQDRVRQLLRHPRLLLDLQELILSSGRPYWHRRAESAVKQGPNSVQRAAIDRDWAWLTANVIEDRITSVPIHSPSVSRPAQHARRSRWRSRSLAALAAAAVVLAVLTFYQWPGRDQKGNGPGGGGVVSSSGWAGTGPMRCRRTYHATPISAIWPMGRKHGSTNAPMTAPPWPNVSASSGRAARS